MSSFYLGIFIDVSLTLLYGIVSGVVAAIVFYYIMMSIKPKIEISDKIAKEKILDDKGNHIYNENGELAYEYVIKIINYSKANVEDLSYQLFIMEDWFSGNGKMFEARDLDFKKPNNMKLLVGLNEKDHTSNNNCRQIVIKGNLENDWDKNKEWLEFLVVSYHSKSGSRKVHKAKYTDRRLHIQEGYFETGHSMKIIPY